MLYLETQPLDVIYLIICINYEGTYIGQTECPRERMSKTKSSIRNANASSYYTHNT